MTKLSRRQFGLLIATTGLVGVRPLIVHAEDRELVVVSWGGMLDEPFRRNAKALEAKHPGVTVRLVPGQGAQVIAEVKAAQGASPYDTFGNDDPALLEAIDQGVVTKIDPAKLANLGNVRPDFMAKTFGYGVPVTFTTMGIAYNTQLVKTPPSSWTDLWKPEYKGLVGVPRVSSNLGLGMLAIVARAWGGSDENLEPGFAKLKELNPIVAQTPALLGQLLERQEVGIAVLWHTNTAVAAGKGLPVKFVKPAPGPLQVISVHAMLVHGRNPDLAIEFLDNTLTADYQQFASRPPYYFGITVKDLAPPREAVQYVPVPGEPTQIVDWTKIVPRRAQLTERWDRLFTG